MSATSTRSRFYIPIGTNYRRIGGRSERRPTREIKMFDALMIVAGVAFFAIAIAYVTACDRL